MEAESGDMNDGNFRDLIRYRGKYDEVFKNDITSAGRNAQYLSPRVQNEILSACNDLILERLVDYINRSSFFKVLLQVYFFNASKEKAVVKIRMQYGKLVITFLEVLKRKNSFRIVASAVCESALCLHRSFAT